MSESQPQDTDEQTDHDSDGGPNAKLAAVSDGLKDQYRAQMLNSIGGISGTIIAAVPTVVFVIANARFGLRRAIVAAVLSAILLTIYRLLRRQPIQQALSGLFGVVVAAVIAARTGQAKGYFLLGIWTSFIYGGALLISVLVRRPLAGVLWEFLDPTPQDGEHEAEGSADPSALASATSATSPAIGPDGGPVGESDGESESAPEPELVPWYRRPPLLRAYTWATAVGAFVFLARGIVQQTLFQHNATGWLAVARIGMGFPPYIAALAFGVWIVRRARVELAESDLASRRIAADADASEPRSGADDATDSGL
ncbi:uncharacterized protein DUF3159 [Jatrophihabitans sp. GAS493]|uniref:DUF3159 domain-containing protein n=1 Tax=Jatrophihabitans sp. GAS493 TaxID=1907575 RepID=UPI000BB6AF16|nr:DUF3159 domain-containing protein [Jatrophihabitans sp. GAS493]SOD74081.1 uncharacterized protein DUF3159 [Jatrophihabitans sp. GAS493]